MPGLMLKTGLLGYALAFVIGLGQVGHNTQAYAWLVGGSSLLTFGSFPVKVYQVCSKR